MHTKPVILYKANAAVPAILSPNAVVVKRDGSIYANKAELTAYVDTLYVPPTSDTYLCVICSCAIEYEYVDSSEVPSGAFNCTCGKKIFEYS